MSFTGLRSGRVTRSGYGEVFAVATYAAGSMFWFIWKKFSGS